MGARRVSYEAHLPVGELLPWNAYPWYINRKPTTAELDAAAEPLRRLIGLLPRLRVVLLHGGDAQKGSGSDTAVQTSRRPACLTPRVGNLPGGAEVGRTRGQSSG